MEQKADHGLQFRAVAVGERDAEQHVAAAVVAMEKGVEARAKAGEEAGLLVAAEMTHRLGQRRLRETLARAAISIGSGTRAVGRQLDELRRAGQRLLPVVEAVLEIRSDLLVCCHAA